VTAVNPSDAGRWGAWRVGPPYCTDKEDHPARQSKQAPEMKRRRERRVGRRMGFRGPWWFVVMLTIAKLPPGNRNASIVVRRMFRVGLFRRDQGVGCGVDG